jgi:hypothetical protein
LGAAKHIGVSMQVYADVVIGQKPEDVNSDYDEGLKNSLSKKINYTRKC